VGVRVRVRLKGFFLVPKSHPHARAEVSSGLSSLDPMAKYEGKRILVGFFDALR